MIAFPRRGAMAALIAVGLGTTISTPAASQRLGLFFDDQAGQCAAPIDPGFGRAHVFVFAFVPPESVISGVAFRVVLPSQIALVDGSVILPRQFMGVTEGTLTEGIDVRFEDCVAPSAPLLIVEFDVEDGTFGGPRPDLRLEIQGAGLDSMAAVEPRFRICDPKDPLGEGRGIYEALGVDATLNCTMRCGCTTAALPKRWGEIKSLYR